MDKEKIIGALKKYQDDLAKLRQEIKEGSLTDLEVEQRANKILSGIDNIIVVLDRCVEMKPSPAVEDAAKQGYGNAVKGRQRPE